VPQPPAASQLRAQSATNYDDQQRPFQTLVYSRLDAVMENGNTLEGLQYLGLDEVVTRLHPLIGVDQTFIKRAGEPNGDAGDQYSGLDRFDRVVDVRWVKADGTATDRFQYGYDRDSNPLFTLNVVNPSLSELGRDPRFGQAPQRSGGLLARLSGPG
jgi:hypothetical protein